MSNNLKAFLNKHRVKNNATHTGVFDYRGNYKIPNNKIKTFHKLCSKYKHSLMEKPYYPSPLRLDIDIKTKLYPGEDRMYNKKMITDIIKEYHKYIESDELCKAFVFEKKKPCEYNGYYKDGFHIMFPFTKMDKQTQMEILQNVKNAFDGYLDDVELNDLDEVFDKASVTNNWVIYGGTIKKSKNPYRLTTIYDKKLKKVNINYSKEELINILSIRKYSVMNKYMNKDVDDMKNDVVEEDNYNNYYEPLENKQKEKSDNSVNLNYIDELVSILSKKRANDYNAWISVGLCLFNISNKLLNSWDKFSKKSSKYKKGVCKQKWKTFKQDNINIGCLCNWAKDDNKEEFYKINRKYSKNNLDNIVKSCTNYGIASLLYEKYSCEYVCASIEKKIWYKFENHRWKEIEKGTTLRHKISTTLTNIFQDNINKCKKNVEEAGEEDKVKLNKDLANAIKNLNKLKTTKFKNDVMIECCEIFYDSKFINKLDNNIYLIGFNNGVYDLEKGIFRDGSSEDYISLTTNTDYNESSKYYKDIDTFLTQIFPNKKLKEYVCLKLASYLQGNNKEETFDIWIGCGGNGKSKLLELFEKSFGEYCCKLPISVLTKQRCASNAATPELASTKGRRLVSVQETEPTDKLQVGIMKEFTGNDQIYARELFKSPISFKPQWNLLMLCNHLPAISSNDDGTWRRIRAIEFISRFIEKPVKKYEYKRDNDLTKKLKIWKDYFLGYLFEYYKEYQQNGIVEPECVLNCSKEYQKTQDFYGAFIEEFVEESEDDSIKINDVYRHFKDWFKENYNMIGEKIPKRMDLNGYLLKRFGKYDNKVGWKGYRIKDEYDDEEKEDDLDAGCQF